MTMTPLTKVSLLAMVLGLTVCGTYEPTWSPTAARTHRRQRNGICSLSLSAASINT
jgi:hypothetical protein